MKNQPIANFIRDIVKWFSGHIQTSVSCYEFLQGTGQLFKFRKYGFQRMVLVILASVFSFTASDAQTWSGFETGNFAGVHGLQLQPASLAGGPFKADINIISVNAALYGNDILPNSNILKGLNGNYIADYLSLFKVTSNDFTLKANVQLPSFIYSINEKNAIAFNWRLKAFSINRTTELSIKDLFRGQVDEESGDQSYSNEFLRVYILSWSEYSASYGRVLFENNLHKLKMGMSAKLLQGTGSLAVELGDVDVSTQGDTALTYLGMSANYVFDKNVKDILEGGKLNMLGSTGFAFDAGIEYEFGKLLSASGSYADYLLKIGFSATDMGSIKFDAAKRKSFSASAENVSLNTFNDITSLSQLADTLDNIFQLEDIDQVGKYRVRLPLHLSTQLDYNLGKNFFLNLIWSMNLNKLVYNNAPIPNTYLVRLTPRYESSSYGVYLPMEVNSAGLVHAGIALRWKAFIVGSKNIISRWFYDDNKVVGDLYLAIKAPLLKKEFQTHRPIVKRRVAKKVEKSMEP